MSRLSITMGKLNSRGIYAAIENSERDDLTVYENNFRSNAKRACRESAKRLRLLADAFDILATMDDPFKIKTQNAAMAAARRAAKTSTSEGD